jgi:hypothetical protein
VLGTPSPSVTPTNLLYNVVPARVRYGATGGSQTGGRLTWLRGGLLLAFIVLPLIRLVPAMYRC